mmetsp:Transcript_95683/g.310002  ORF Transcript_95683/g.310002 Transcript_95683/m.310002 type:complete len:212 (+) Transcript_95683:43-678(+)
MIGGLGPGLASGAAGRLNLVRAGGGRGHWRTKRKTQKKTKQKQQETTKKEDPTAPASRRCTRTAEAPSGRTRASAQAPQALADAKYADATASAAATSAAAPLAEPCALSGLPPPVPPSGANAARTQPSAPLPSPESSAGTAATQCTVPSSAGDRIKAAMSLGAPPITCMRTLGSTSTSMSTMCLSPLLTATCAAFLRLAFASVSTALSAPF